MRWRGGWGRELLATRQSLLIALTGYSQEQDRITSQEAGFDHYLVKPTNIDALLDLIRNTRAGTNPPA